MRQDRHPQGRNCQDLALLLVVFSPIAVPALVARTWWLRRKGVWPVREGEGTWS